MNSMRKLINLMEGVIAVPGVGQQNEAVAVSAAAGDTESDMQTAGTIGRNNSYAAFDAAQGQATEESVSDDDVAEYTRRLNQLWAEKNERLSSGMDFSASEKIYGQGYQQLLRDMPEAHNEYVDRQNKRLWAGNTWQRDDKSARSAVDEKAPPGMEDVVMKLKKEYPDDHSKAFATAWSIYNKKHGKANESVPAVDSCQQTNPASADVACAMEEGNMSDYMQGVVDQVIHEFGQLSDAFIEEYDAKEIVTSRLEQRGFSGEEISEIMTAVDEQLNGFDHSAFDMMNPDDEVSEDAASDVESRHGNALRKLEHLIAKTGYKDGEIASQTGNTGGAPITSALDIWYAYQDAHPELMGDEGRLTDRMEKAYNDAYEAGYSGLEEAYDIQNGYNDVEVASGKDYFPNGADSPVVDKTGAAGARQGDNPEQKKMQVAETHKELVYAYRKFLKESAS